MRPERELALEALDKIKSLREQESLIRVDLSNQALATKWVDSVLERMIRANRSVEHLDVTQKQSLMKYVKMAAGTHEFAILLICAHKECPFWKNCEFNLDKSLGDPKKGEVCPIEAGIAAIKTLEYMKEIGVTEDDAIDMAFVRELANLDIIDHRMNMLLSDPKRATLVDESFSGEYDDEGNELMMKHVAFEWNIRTQVANRKREILKALVASRYEKYKKDVAQGKREGDDPSSTIGKDRDKYEDITEKYRKDFIQEA